VEGGLYSFSNQPNLNRIIVEKEEAVHDEHIAEAIRAAMDKVAGNELRVTPWPKTPQDVPDTKDLKLAVLSPEYPRQSGETNAFVAELLGKSGTAFRVYRNTLLVLAPDSGEFAALRQQVKRSLALHAIREDKALMRQMSEENKRTLESKQKDTEGGIPFRIFSAYRHLAKAGESGVEWFDLGLPTVGEKGSLARRVREFLKSQDLLLSRISPTNLLRKTLRDDESEKPFGDITDAFLKYPQLPMLEDEALLRGTVQQGVREGTFGVRVGERVYLNEFVPDSALEYGAVLVRKEVAEQAKQRAGEVMPQPAEPGETTLREKESTAGVVTVSPATPVGAGVHSLRLRVKVSWDRLSDFVRGVIMPLHNDGAELEVEVFVQARSESGGIKPATREHKVKETLRQIGAEVVEEFYK